MSEMDPGTIPPYVWEYYHTDIIEQKFRVFDLSKITIIFEFIPCTSFQA